jgi:Na+-driven multidrug efflux pump
MLALLHVDTHLRRSAARYIYWRAIVAPAALAQSICLSIMLVTRDAIRPLKVVCLAAFLNVIFDALLCAWPLKWGCAGAAAATSLATVISCWFMVNSLKEKGLMPKIRKPSMKEIRLLLEFTGPLLAITLTRLGGFIAMQRAAMRLGLNALAGYQLCINVLLFFLLFGEPLSQLSQTKLPTLLDNNDSRATLATLKSILILAGCTSVSIATLSYFALMFGTSMITSDLNVQAIARSAAPSMFIAVSTSIFAVAVDGAQLAAKDFDFMLLLGLTTMFTQLRLLPYCVSVSTIFDTFTIRLGTYAVASLVRAFLGYGKIGCVIRNSPWMVGIKRSPTITRK